MIQLSFPNFTYEDLSRVYLTHLRVFARTTTRAIAATAFFAIFCIAFATFVNGKITATQQAF